MVNSFTLYTLTGQREAHYAAVDLATGRVWTSPNKDGALRQARDAGLDSFVEKSITREALLRLMGISGDWRLPVGTSASRSASVDAESAPKRAAGDTSWFMPGEGHGGAGKMPMLPRSPEHGKKKGKKPPSPFGGGELIHRDAIDKDLLVVPDTGAVPKPSAAFAEAAPPPEPDILEMKIPGLQSLADRTAEEKPKSQAETKKPE